MQDSGVLINPMIVDGQVRGGVVQGIGVSKQKQVHGRGRV
jgi:carbon-monoxide dehydrogenase large subunit